MENDEMRYGRMSDEGCGASRGGATGWNARIDAGRKRLVDTICTIASIYVFSIFNELWKPAWWRYVVAIGVMVALDSIYHLFFRKVLFRRAVNSRPISTAWKYICIAAVFGASIVSIGVYFWVPSVFVVKWLLSLFVNFILTMLICYVAVRA